MAGTHAKGGGEVASTVGRADALAVVEMMAGWIKQRAAEGREVDFGPLGQGRR